MKEIRVEDAVGTILSHDVTQICLLYTSGLRNLEDAIKIKEEAEKVKNVVVLGAGLAGLVDRYDGRVARYLNVSSDLGKELDSLAEKYLAKL